jgi:hypothetical protein
MPLFNARFNDMTTTDFLTPDHISNYDRDGFVLIENVFTQPEVQAMIAEIEAGRGIDVNTRVRLDAKGKKTKLAIWHTLDDDIWGAVSTSPRLVNNVRILLRQEVAFFHGKVMLKEAHTGGAWEWHQDYGYWYDQGFVFPRMLSAFIALDPARRDNGCLQVLRGSHQMGRLNHIRIGSQSGVEKSRIQEVESLFTPVQCEMASGSVLYFDSNLLHTSGPNESDHHRRSLIIAYTALGNPQIGGQQTASPVRCPVSADDAIVARFASVRR